MNHLPGHILAMEDNRIHRLKLFRSLEQGCIITLADLCRALEKLVKVGILAGAAGLLSQVELPMKRSK